MFGAPVCAPITMQSSVVADPSVRLRHFILIFKSAPHLFAFKNGQTPPTCPCYPTPQFLGSRKLMCLDE